MSSICSTCRFNGGTVEEIYKFVFKAPLANGVPKDLIYCKCRDRCGEVMVKLTDGETAIIKPAKKLSDCKYWEVCN